MTVQVAFNTDYYNEALLTTELEAMLGSIASAGFTHIHWCHEWSSNYLYAKAEMQQIHDWLRQFNLQAKGIHASAGGLWKMCHGIYRDRNPWDDRKDFTSENEYNRQAGRELIENRVELAHEIGAREIVLHMQLPWEPMQADPSFKARYYQQVFKSFDELQPFCRERQVRIAIENLPGEPIELSKERFNRLFERYDDDFMGFCFDSGHGAIMSPDNPLEMLEAYRHRLIAVHLNDNRSLTKEELLSDPMISAADLHLPPFAGVLDWDRLIALVADSPYEMPLLMELVYRPGAESEQDYLNRMYQCGVRLTEMIYQHR